MTPQDKDTIRNALPPQHGAAITIVPAKEPGPVDDRMNQFCDQLQAAAPHVRLKTDYDSAFPAPALIVGSHGNIAYQAIPQGKFVRRFLDAMTQGVAPAPIIGKEIDEQLKKINLPVVLKIYIAAQCPHCPSTLRQVQTLAGASSKFRLTVIDAALFHDSARTDGVRSVPTIILDDRFRWSGQVELAEILTICIERDPAQLSAGSLRQLIEEGDAPMVAQMMIDNQKIFPALVELLAHERWSVRLGAMVTVEYLVEDAPELTAGLVAPLWHRMANASQQAQGDMVHVLGQIPTAQARKYVQQVAQGDYDQAVVAAAVEAIKEM